MSSLSLQTYHHIRTKDDRLMFYKPAGKNKIWSVNATKNHKYSEVDDQVVSQMLKYGESTLKDTIKRIEGIYQKLDIPLPIFSSLIRTNYYIIEEFEKINIIKTPNHKGWKVIYRNYINDEAVIIFNKELEDLVFDKRSEALSYFSQWVKGKEEQFK